MKITGITLDNWLAHAHRKVEVRPLTLITGPNASGKTSVADAVRYVLANALTRVDTRGERDLLAHDGSGKKAGAVTIAFATPDGATGSVSRDLTGAMKTTGASIPATGVVAGAALRVALNPSDFARMDTDARREALLAVMRVDLGPEAILTELAERMGTHAVEPLRAAGDMAAWRKMADEQQQQGRGAWKQITGEAYGTKKADGWTAPVPADVPSEKDVQAAGEKAAQADARRRELQMEQGRREGRHAEAKRHAQTFDAMRESASALEDRRAALVDAQIRLTEATAYLSAARERRAGMTATQRHTMNCPDCGSVLKLDGQGGLCTAEVAEVGDSAADIRLADQQIRDGSQSFAAVNEEVSRLQKAVDQAENARVTLKGATSSTEHPLPDVAQIKAAVLAAEQEHAMLARQHVDMSASLRGAEEAQKRSQWAAIAHGGVIIWGKIAALLAPDGIPGELLAKALDGFNRELRTNSPAGWRVPSIAPDAGILADGRQYRFLSESEQWRADAVIGVTFARLSGLRMVILDRLDVLEPALRGPALRWLLDMANSEALETILVMATLKTPLDVSKAARAIGHWFGDEQQTAKAA